MAISGFGALGYNIALCEFRGYGRSDGSPSQEHITADFETMLKELLLRPEVDASRLIYYGRSLGGGVVCSLAREHSPTGIILQSTFSSLKAMVRVYLLPPPLVRDPFDNEAVLRDFVGPVLLMHGEYDQVIPFKHSERLHSVARNSQLVSFDSDHNDFPMHSPEFWRSLEQFLGEPDETTLKDRQ